MTVADTVVSDPSAPTELFGEAQKTYRIGARSDFGCFTFVFQDARWRLGD